MERTVAVLIAEASADPWWDRMPSDQMRDQPPLKPLSGPPDEIAGILRKYEQEGVAHIQICMEPTTVETIEELVPVLEALDKLSAG